MMSLNLLSLLGFRLCTRLRARSRLVLATGESKAKPERWKVRYAGGLRLASTKCEDRAAAAVPLIIHHKSLGIIPKAFFIMCLTIS